MAGIGVLLNRNAGKKKLVRGNLGSKLAFVLGDRNSVLQTNSIAEIEEVARTFLARDIEILGISGGDGSNHTTVSTFLRVYGERPLPKIAFLCGGTHNAHASSLGIKGSPEQILSKILRSYHEGSDLDLTTRPILRIDDGNLIHHGFSMATGYMHRFYQELVLSHTDSVAKSCKLLASWLASMALGGRRVRHMFRLSPQRVIVRGLEADWPENNAVCCSCMEKLGLGFAPFPRASEDPACFHVGLFRVSPATCLRLLPQFKRGAIPKHKDMQSIASDRVEIEALDDQAIAYVLDGELYPGTQRLTVTAGPQLQFVH